MKTKNILKYFLTVLIWVTFLIPSSLIESSIAQKNHLPSPVEIKASVDKPVATVGDLIRFKIELQTARDIKPQEPDPLKVNGGLIYVRREIPEISFSNNRNIAIFYYIFRADQVGRFAIPSIKIKFLAPDTREPTSTIEGSIVSPEIFVEVKSVLKANEGPLQLQDIKPLIKIKRSFMHYWPYALALILIVLIIFFIAKKQKRNFIKHQMDPIKKPPCHVLALQELQILKKKNLLDEGAVREHYFELSEIFRKYIGTRFLFPALDRTQQEIFDCLKKNLELNSHLKNEINIILEQTDKVKFAKLDPSTKKSNEIMESVTEFIKSTIPAPKEQQESSAGPTLK